MEPCPDCGKGEMTHAKFELRMKGKEDEPYPGYSFVCTKCGEQTVICLENEAAAIETWNRIAVQVREANAIAGEIAGY